MHCLPEPVEHLLDGRLLALASPGFQLGTLGLAAL